MGKFGITLEERSGLSATATHTVHLRQLDQLGLVTRLHECATYIPYGQKFSLDKI